jgi:hypothetical protein
MKLQNAGTGNLVNINIGDKWYVKLPQAQCVVSATILELSSQTVLLEFDNDFDISRSSRYITFEINWVEKLS